MSKMKVNLKVTVNKRNKLVDTDNWDVEYTSTRTQQLTNKCKIEIKVADSSKSSDNSAGSEHRIIDLFNLTLKVASTGNKVVRTLQSASGTNWKKTVEETNSGSKRMKGHSSDADSSSSQDKKELKQNSGLDDELYSKNNGKLNKKSEQDFESFEKNWKKIQVVREQECDLFGTPNEYSLAHCVAEDFNMSSGLATSFRLQFKNFGGLYSQKQKQGGVAYLKNKDRYVYYLVTKRVSSDKPTYLNMWNSLRRLRLRMEEHGVKKLAVPRLGCGWDRLEWVKVKAMLETIFEGMEDVEIVVCNFQQIEGTVTKFGQKWTVVNVAKGLFDIDRYTILISLVSEANTIIDTTKSIDKKHSFIYRLNKPGKRTIGTAFAVDFEKFTLYSFIVRRCKNDPLDFEAFESCAQQLNRQNKKRKPRYYYVAMEAFKDPQDDLMLDKLVNILRCVLLDMHVYICWPEELVRSMPRENTD